MTISKALKRKLRKETHKKIYDLLNRYIIERDGFVENSKVRRKLFKIVDAVAFYE
jgi:hypothetical protein